MRNKFSDKFYDLYNEGFNEYEHGDWEKAKKHFDMSKNLLKEDGPIEYLLKVMGFFGFQRPAEWKGNNGGDGH
jgi:hypothetical protein